VLLAMGHQEIGYLTPPIINDHYSYADRCLGYRQAMEVAGLKTHVVEHGRIPGSQLRQAVCELVKANANLTAWLSYSDTVAVHICHVLEQMGHVVGETHHVSTVGAAISLQLQYLEHYPILHTPHIWETVGQQAVELLLKKIKNPKTRQTSKAVHVPYQL